MRTRPVVRLDAVAADPCGLRRRERWNGTGRAPAFPGGAAGDVDRKGASERANRPRGARGCGCGHALPLRLRAAFSASEPMRSGLPLVVCPARLAQVIYTTSRWRGLQPAACPKQEPRKTMWSLASPVRAGAQWNNLIAHLCWW